MNTSKCEESIGGCVGKILGDFTGVWKGSWTLTSAEATLAELGRASYVDTADWLCTPESIDASAELDRFEEFPLEMTSSLSCLR